MGSLFQGEPQKATSYTTSTSETPKWMQDAIYNQIQVAQNLANMPYQQYALPRVAELTPLQQQAYANVQANQGFWQDDINNAQSGMYKYGTTGTAADLSKAQQNYLSQSDATTNLTKAGDLFKTASEYNIPTAASPYLKSAESSTTTALADRALKEATPYLTAAGKTSVGNITSYMSPYQQGVLDVIAKQGARNLRENIMPGVGEAFIKAGQFGSSRMGEMGARAMRDTQEAILNAQAQAAQQGYGQALGASQADLARQAQLASTVGSISGADLSRILQGGAQYGQLGQISGQLTGQQMQNIAALAQARAQAGQAQQQFGLTAAQQAQQAAAADYQRQMSALTQYANMQQQEQAMKAADVAALETAGQAQQTQKQRELDMAYQQHLESLAYPKQQMDWLSTQIRGMAPITPQTVTQTGQTTGATYSPSPLSQLAAGVYAYKGLSSLP